MGALTALREGREAFARQRWRAARDLLASCPDQLGGEDLDRLAVAMHLLGQDEEGVAVRERAHRAFLDEGQPRRAARSAFWLGMALALGGEPARGGGWLTRAARLLADDPDAVEHAYLLIPQGLQADADGDPATARQLFGRALEEADDRADHDLAALARLGLGWALVQLGDPAAGLGLMDEAMVSVAAGEVGPLPAGIVCCGVIDGCQRVADVRRAREWTAVLSAWCDRQPDLVPFQGQCLVHRSQVAQLQGDWPLAVRLAQDAVARLSAPPGHAAVGEAHYQRGELHRIRGEVDDAEAAYREANRAGRIPHPGLALLRLDQGRADAAAAALGRALAEDPDRPRTAHLLAAQVEALLGADQVVAARAALDRLEAEVSVLGTEVLQAMAAGCRGAVLLAEGAAAPALTALREALTTWQALGVPYETARVRVLLARACRDLDDDEGFAMEVDAADATFEHLGAGPARRRLQELVGRVADQLPAGLTAREVEVLRLVAVGKTNKAIADALVISEHTVARHLQHILAKLGVGTRTAAAAFAHQHGIV